MEPSGRPHHRARHQPGRWGGARRRLSRAGRLAGSARTQCSAASASKGCTRTYGGRPADTFPFCWPSYRCRTPAIASCGCTLGLRDLSEQEFAQQTLAESERRVRRAEALALTGSFVVDALDGSAQWSDGMYRILGTHPAEFAVSLSTHLERVHEADRAGVTALFDGALSGDHRSGWTIG